jgi:hypothetical protein
MFSFGIMSWLPLFHKRRVLFHRLPIILLTNVNEFKNFELDIGIWTLIMPMFIIWVKLICNLTWVMLLALCYHLKVKDIILTCLCLECIDHTWKMGYILLERLPIIITISRLVYKRLMATCNFCLPIQCFKPIVFDKYAYKKQNVQCIVDQF